MDLDASIRLDWLIDYIIKHSSKARGTDYAAKLQGIYHVTTMKDLCGFLRRNLVGPL